MVKREYAGEGEPRNGSLPQSSIIHGHGPRAAANESARTQDLPLLSPIIRTLSERTIAQIRSEFPGWDIYALQAGFITNGWMKTPPTPKNYEAAFYGWVRQHHARNRAQVS
jgi:hypothetical protein